MGELSVKPAAESRNKFIRALVRDIEALDQMLHEGLFEDTWPSVAIPQIAFVHIDCDWYDPVSYCLEAVADKMPPGGVIVIDDYHDYGGCHCAVDEFRARRDDFSFDPGANPILCKL